MHLIYQACLCMSLNLLSCECVCHLCVVPFDPVYAVHALEMCLILLHVDVDNELGIANNLYTTIQVFAHQASQF